MNERRAPINPFDSAAFREEFEATLDKKLEPLTKLVEEHERYVQRSKGVIGAMALLWGGVEFLLHRLK